MAERKVLNKYLPPDFDPAKVPKGRRTELGRCDIRMMLPMNVQCLKCSEFMYKGTKFNSKKEDVVGEDYLGMKIFRFIMKCTRCNSLFSIKTDPMNADYVVEYGASRNFEPWREDRAAFEKEKEKKEKVASMDTMKSLELRTEDSLRQMEEMDRLEQLRNRRAQQFRLGLTPEALLSEIAAGAETKQTNANEEGDLDTEARELFQLARSTSRKRPLSTASPHEVVTKKPLPDGSSTTVSGIQRLPASTSLSHSLDARSSLPGKASPKPQSLLPSSIVGFARTKKTNGTGSDANRTPEPHADSPDHGITHRQESPTIAKSPLDQSTSGGAFSSLFAYGSDSDSD